MIGGMSLAVSTAGAAGSAVGSASGGVVTSRLLSVGVKYHASAPATTDVVVKCISPSGTKTILTLTNNNTNKPPMVVNEGLVDSSGAAVADSVALPIISGAISVEVAGCDALTAAVVVTLVFEV